MNKLLEVEVDNFNKTDSKLDISTKSDTENNNQDNQEPDQSVKEEEDEQVIIEEEDYESEFEIDADFSDLNHLNFPEYCQIQGNDNNSNNKVDANIDEKRKRLEDLRQKLTETKKMEEEMKLLEI